MELNFKRVEDKYDRYKYGMISIIWDKKHTYSLDGQIGLNWMFQEMILAYSDDNLVGIGEINTFYEDKIKKARLGVITNPNYRKKGIANSLINEMLVCCRDELDVEIVVANILSTNKKSLSKAQKNEFELIGSNGKILTYEKKLINKR